MLYLLLVICGVIAGVVSCYGLLEVKRRRLDEQKGRQETLAHVQHERELTIRTKQEELDRNIANFRAECAKFESVISYGELRNENTILKRDLQNIDVNVRKLELDRELQRDAQMALDKKTTELATRHLKDTVKWIGDSISPNNFSLCKDRLTKAIAGCREIGFTITTDEESTLLENLRDEYKKTVRAAYEREEQARIKAQIREEQLREKEIDRELKQLERERLAIKAALEKALAEAKDEHSAEVEQLRKRLTEAEEKAQRAISQAQLTKSGHVYVISNIGSFGDGVFKVGMTRRLEPLERVNELGSASVPFPFDVHMMISSNDAPTLENKLHRALNKLRINKARPRKEFFKTDLDTICKIVRENHGEVEYIADPEALEYRQSMSMSDQDQEFIESVYQDVEKDSNGVDVED